MSISDYRVKSGQKFDAVVYPSSTPLHGKVVAQPSKNYTTRYVLAAGLADGESIIRNCATSADSAALQDCLRQMGAVIEQLPTESGDGVDLKVCGVGGKPRLADEKPINPGNAGAVLRFLLGVAALLPEVKFVTDHHESLGKRPNKELLDALEQLGCATESIDGKLPVTLRGGNLHGGKVIIDASRSSQFLSGLLFLAPLVGEPIEIQVAGEVVSKAPIRQTLEVLRNTGIHFSAAPDLRTFTIQPGMYRSGVYTVNGDWPGSAALLAAAAVTGGSVELEQLKDDEQGEKASGDVLSSMGAQFSYLPENSGVFLRGSSELKGINFDGDLATDAVLALMGAAALAKGRMRIYNVSNLRIKECDRISEPIAELRKLGVKCWEGNELGDEDGDAIIIEGQPEGYEGGVTVDGRDDHRVIMLLSIVALRCKKSVRILRAHQIAKSYPGYFVHLAQLGAKVEFKEPAA